MEKKIFLYARISRDDGNKNIQTIESQVRLLEEYAAKKELGTVENIFVDDNVTGAVFDRPAFQKMEEHIKNGWQGILLVKDLSRLGRNNAKTLLMLDWFEEQNVHVITADGRYDSACDNELAGIETWYNERYIRDISRKTRASIRSKQEQGLHLGKAPYGYRNMNKKLVIDDREAKTVKEIFFKYLSGMGINAITGDLNAAKVIPPGYVLYGNEWRGQTVKRILQNVEYCGHTAAAKSHRATYKNKRQVANKKEDWVVTYHTHPAIIGQGEYDTVQSMLAENTGCRRQGGNVFLNVLSCGKCGSPMYRRNVHGVWGYVCAGYAKNGAECCSRHFCHESSLYETITKELFDMLKRTNTPDGEIAGGEIKRLEEKMLKVYKDYINEYISKDIFIRVSKELEREKEQIYALKSAKKYNMEDITADEIKKCIDTRVINTFIKEIRVFELQEAAKKGIPGIIKDGLNQSVGSVALVTLK